MEFPQMEQERINDIINGVDVEGIKPKEIDSLIRHTQAPDGENS